MTAFWHVLLAPTVLTDANNKLYVSEGGTYQTLTVPRPGGGAWATGISETYYLRGDSASDDLLEKVRAGIQTHTGGNSYTANLFLYAGTSTSSILSIYVATGINSVTWGASNALNTFDESLLGFPNSTQSFTGSPLTLTTTTHPSPIWVASLPSTEEVPSFEAIGTQAVMKGGQVYDFDAGGPYHRRRLGITYNAANRTLVEEAGSNPNRSFQRFWQNNRNGKVLELHRVTAFSGDWLNQLSYATLVGKFVFDEPTRNTFAPVRLKSQALYSFAIGLREYVA